MKIGDVVRIEFNDGQQMIGLYNGEDERCYYITHILRTYLKETEISLVVKPIVKIKLK
jgi:hypothetical protein